MLFCLLSDELSHLCRNASHSSVSTQEQTTSNQRLELERWATARGAATLAGNFTLVGSVANLIVAQRAKVRGVEFNFLAYFKVGAPLTFLTIAFGLLWL